jgi:hypothetical protein
LEAWIARSAAVARTRNAVLPEEAQQVALAGAAAEAHIVAEHIAAVVDIARSHTAAAVGPEQRTAAEAALMEVASEAVARRPAPAEGRRIPAEVAATEPPGFRERIALAAEARQPQKLLLPAPVRRRKGNLSWREERRVRIADISS